MPWTLHQPACLGITSILNSFLVAFQAQDPLTATIILLVVFNVDTFLVRKVAKMLTTILTILLVCTAQTSISHTYLPSDKQIGIEIYFIIRLSDYQSGH
jgi:hypothetical protein